MLTEIDYGVGNITGALKARGMWERSVVIFHTDNGGPDSHACNWPHRGWVRRRTRRRTGSARGALRAHAAGTRGVARGCENEWRDGGDVVGA